MNTTQQGKCCDAQGFGEQARRMNSVSTGVGTDRDGQQMVPGLRQEGQGDFTGKEAFLAGQEVEDVATWHKSSKSLDVL